VPQENDALGVRVGPGGTTASPTVAAGRGEKIPTVAAYCGELGPIVAAGVRPVANS